MPGFYRKFAMPNSETFSLVPVAETLSKWLPKTNGAVIVVVSQFESPAISS